MRLLIGLVLIVSASYVILKFALPIFSSLSSSEPKKNDKKASILDAYSEFEKETKTREELFLMEAEERVQQAQKDLAESDTVSQMLKKQNIT